MLGQIIDFGSLDVKIQELIERAVLIREKAYCPVSKFKVGAALRTTEGAIFAGCNVESVAFSPTVCAERTAVCKGVSEGHHKFNMIVVAADQEEGYTTPCGVCRQVLAEFCEENTMVYMTKPDMKDIFCMKLLELIPLAFTKYS